MKAINKSMTHIVKKNKPIATIKFNLTGIKWYQFKLVLASWLMSVAAYLSGSAIEPSRFDAAWNEYEKIRKE